MYDDTFFGEEATLSELLGDPICRALMRCDGLEPAAVERRLRREAARLRSTGAAVQFEPDRRRRLAAAS